jgi:hypothetical protein
LESRHSSNLGLKQPPQQLLIENEIRGAPLPTVFSPTEDGWREISESAGNQVKRRKRGTAIQVSKTAIANLFEELGWYVSETDTRRVTKKWRAGEHFRAEYGKKVLNIYGRWYKVLDDGRFNPRWHNEID